MQENKRQRALITGASAGIGLELAHVLARNGLDLVITARRQKELIRLQAILTEKYGIDVIALSADLAKAEAAKFIFAELQNLNCAIDILVNNAGFGLCGKFANLDCQSQLNMLQVNIVALTELCSLFLPQMMARRRGGIINLASVAAFQPGPLMAVYYASKAYVLSFSEALANELSDSGLVVTCVCPGPTKTEFDQAAGLKEAKLFKSAAIMQANTVAEMAWQGFVQGKSVVVTGLPNQLLAFSSKVVPRALAAKIARQLHE
jgi:short-subunit dehydrogenase